MVFGNCGVLSADSLRDGKAYVEMTGMDDATSIEICEAIVSKGGRYLETQIQGSKKEAEEGELLLISAGDRSVFDECSTCFQAMSSRSFFLGDVGNAAKMYMVLQVMAGVNLAGLAEAMALGKLHLQYIIYTTNVTFLFFVISTKGWIGSKKCT